MRSFLTSLVLLFSVAVPAWAAGLPDFTQLVERESPAVVNITVTQDSRKMQRRGGPPDDQDEMFDYFFRRFMPPGGGMMPPRRGQGSGFIISADGYILTNAHVVNDADTVMVKLSDRREFSAKVIGADSRTDVALIKIESDKLPKVDIGKADDLKVGEWVLAIGAPFGFENSVTAGIVSAKGRNLPQENYVPFIQTDVVVNPGNSGGPLFNMRGEVVGINSQIISRSGGYMGLSFAIPIDVAMDVADQLKQHGKVNRGRLGVTIQEVTADLAESFGLSKPMGALVADVEPGSPAEKAGVQASDIIIRFDGRDVARSIDLPRMVGAARPGAKVSLTVWRKGRAQDLSAVVGAMPDDEVAQKMGDTSQNRAGIEASALTAEQLRQMKLTSGVRVDSVSGPAAQAGVQPGDVIVAVNNMAINKPDELSRMLNDNRRRSVALLIRRGEGSLYIPLRLEDGSPGSK